jgi:hypothetical protein
LTTSTTGRQLIPISKPIVGQEEKAAVPVAAVNAL